jgi:hypothetical protein
MEWRMPACHRLREFWGSRPPQSASFAESLKLCNTPDAVHAAGILNNAEVPSFQENQRIASRLFCRRITLASPATKLRLTGNGSDPNALKPCAEENFSVNTIDARSKH